MAILAGWFVRLENQKFSINRTTTTTRAMAAAEGEDDGFDALGHGLAMLVDMGGANPVAAIIFAVLFFRNTDLLSLAISTVLRATLRG